ncbi:MAG: hypothetical protein IJV94_04630 [Bacilli bacterium]|nr:hypothetical protein [Bacilli bacterium]
MKIKSFFNKRKISNFLKVVVFDGVGILLFSFITLISFFVNFKEASILMKIFMILGNIYGLLILVYEGFMLFYDASKKNIFYLFPFFISYVLSVICCFDYSLFGIKEFLVGILFLIIILEGVYLVFKKFFLHYLSNSKKILFLISFSTLLIIVSIINEKLSSSFNGIIYYQISLGLIYLIAISIYIYKALNNQKGNNLNSLFNFIFWGLLIIISFPFYIEWCNLFQDNFDAFVNIYASLIGGGITLGGVAWTIKKSDIDRVREKNNSVKPYIYAASIMGDYNGEKSVLLQFTNNENNKNERFLGVIKNTDNGVFIAEKLIVNNVPYGILYSTILDKNYFAEICFYTFENINIESLFLVGSDVLGNEIKYELIIDSDRKEIINVKEAAK